MGIDLGLELDITNYYPTQAGRKRYAATGTSGGATVVGATTSQLNFNSTLVAMNVLTRLPLMVSQEFPNGRISPYFGGGVGFDRTYYRATRLEGTEYDVAYQAKVGAEIFFIKNLSVLGEYKFTATEHTFKDSRGDNDYNFNVNHFVGGVAMHF
jgi:opacity protein-like surface antigen